VLDDDVDLVAVRIVLQIPDNQRLERLRYRLTPSPSLRAAAIPFLTYITRGPADCPDKPEQTGIPVFSFCVKPCRAMYLRYCQSPIAVPVCGMKGTGRSPQSATVSLPGDSD
jgi:hypothetical protein